MSGTIRVGIGGWSFAPWRGSFYPAGLPQSRELEHASRHLTSIEINATFYGTQKASSFRKWRDETPEGFVFSIKAPRVATHRRAFADAADSITRFLESGLTELGDKLGPLLWQFPPTRRFEASVFEEFLTLLPADGRFRHVVEVRHESFASPDFAALLRRFGVACAIVDSDKHPLLDEPTADFVYARLQRNSEAAPEGYASTALDAWAERFRGWANGSVGDKKSKDCFVYFISGEKVAAPLAATALLRRL